MLNVTEGAVDVLSQILDENQIEEEQGLRLAQGNPGEFGLAVDGERDADQVVRKGLRPVLFVGEDVSTALDGATLDVMRGPEGVGLTLRMPDEGAPVS